MDRVVIGSRGSDLALTQTNHMADRLRKAAPDVEVTVEIISTKGDKIQDVPLAKIGGKGLFTKELEVALIEKRIDLAVHSLKDLPTELPAGLAVGAIPERERPFDAFVSADGKALDELPQGARVGTSSLRRKVQLLAHRPDLEIVDLRGNVPTRLRKIEEDKLAATILAAAGLRRLGLADAITHELPPEIMLPAVGQGALGLEIRADDEDMKALLALINDADTEAEVTAERALLTALGGGCQVPLGALGRVENGVLILRACVCSVDGAKIIRAEFSGDPGDAAALGRRTAEALIQQGATAMVANAVAAESGEKQPLAGRSVAVTRAKAQAAETVRGLAALGAHVIEFPVIEVVPADEAPEIGPADAYDWLIFTSVNGVDYFHRALLRAGRSTDEFKGAFNCAVGPATARALLNFGLPVTLTPEEYIAEAIMHAFKGLEGDLAGMRFLLPRGDIARRFLPEALRDAGAEVTEAVVYKTVPAKIPPERIRELVEAPPEFIMFASSSAVRNLYDHLSPEELEILKERSVFASIGPRTTETALELGMPIQIEPDQHEIPALMNAIVAYAEAHPV